MENGFSSPRSDSFPVGLRVLVVDDDLTWLKILEKMLKRCSYEVTTCSLAREALSLLRERKDGFDIVISDVNMPDMDGFKLLEHVGLEMDLPVIMMSVDGETTRVMKGVQHGACDYLLKPIRMKELRNIWQHVFRKKIHEVRDIESLECIEDIQILRNAADQSDSGYFLSGGDLTSAKKRKDFENKHEDRDLGDPASVKKARVVWSVDLHQKFVKAVNQIGFDKVGPKKIRDLMNVPWLTRENVASHLQKYRLYLARLQKENDTKTLPSALNNSDISACELTQNFGLQNSSTMLQNDTVVGHYEFPGRKMLVQNQDPKFHKSDVGSIISQPVTEPETVAVGISNPRTASSSGTGISHSFGLLEPEVNYLAVDSRFQYSWEGEFPEMGFKQEQLQLEHYAQVSRPQHTEPINHEPSMREMDKAVPTEVEPLYARNRTASVHSKSPASSPVSEPISMATTSVRGQGLDQSGLNNSELAPRNRISGGSSAISPLEENLQICWLQGQNLDFWDTYDPELFSEAPLQCYDEPTVDYEYLNDSTGYLLIDQGLFLA